MDDYNEYHQYLVHIGPQLLAETLPKERLNRRRSLMKLDVDLYRAWSFITGYRCYQHQPRLPAVMIGPANPYQNQGISPELSRIPEAERPSAGWMWFSHKYGIPAGGIGPQRWFADESNMHDPADEDELSWGCPFWDMERLGDWGLEMSWSAENSPPHG